MVFGSPKFFRKVPSWVVLVVGLLISAVALFWTYHDVDLKTLTKDLASTSWAWVPLAALADLLVYVWQSWRWNMLLAPILRIPLWRTIRAIYVGLFVNELLPMRPGELLRAYLQARWNRAPFSVTLSSVIIERFFDAIWLLVVTFLATFFVELPGHTVGLARLLLVLVAIGAAVLAAVNWRRQKADGSLAPKGWLGVLLADLRLMGRSRSFYLAFLLSLPYLLSQTLPVYLLMKAYRLDLSIWVAMIVVLMQRVGTALPQGPGNVGVLQLMTKQGLGLFGVDETTAAGFATLAWIVITAPLLAAGAVAVTVTGMRFSELRRQAGTLAPAAAEPQVS